MLTYILLRWSYKDIRIYICVCIQCYMYKHTYLSFFYKN